VLLESPVARAVTRTIVQASSGMSWREERPEDVVSNRMRGHQCIRRCSGVLERMAIIKANCSAHRVTCSRGKNFPRKMVDMKKMLARVWSH